MFREINPKSIHKSPARKVTRNVTQKQGFDNCHRRVIALSREMLSSQLLSLNNHLAAAKVVLTFDYRQKLSELSGPITMYYLKLYAIRPGDTPAAHTKLAIPACMVDAKHFFALGHFSTAISK